MRELTMEEVNEVEGGFWVQLAVGLALYAAARYAW